MVDTVKSNWQAIGVILGFIVTISGLFWNASRTLSATEQQQIFLDRAITRIEQTVSVDSFRIKENEKDIVRLKIQDEAQCQRITKLETKVN